jgi:hypothetical protein
MGVGQCLGKGTANALNTNKYIVSMLHVSIYIEELHYLLIFMRKVKDLIHIVYSSLKRDDKYEPVADHE